MKRILIVLMLIISIATMTGCSIGGSLVDAKYKVVANGQISYYFVYSYEFEPDEWFTGYDSEGEALMVIREKDVVRIEKYEK